MEEDKDNKRKLIVMEEGSVEEEKAELRATAVMLTKRGNADGMKILQDLHLQDKYESLITNCDDDEYEFAG